MIRLSVPGALSFRDLVLRVVASSCKLVRSAEVGTQEASHDDSDHHFDTKVVSAVSEVFNNIAIHGYENRAAGVVDIEIELSRRCIKLRLADTGRRFDPEVATSEDPGELPESHMGLFIVRKFMDEFSYEPGDAPGAQNVMTLTKRL